jgi:Family of unknown function (DUF6527)
MKKVSSKLWMNEETGYTLFFCLGCDQPHAVGVKGSGAWGYNGNPDQPTFTPSVGVNLDRSAPQLPRCHSFVTDGRIQFLTDSDHALAGQTVDLPDWPEHWSVT